MKLCVLSTVLASFLLSHGSLFSYADPHVNGHVDLVNMLDDEICESMAKEGRCEDEPEEVTSFCKKSCHEHLKKHKYFSSHEIDQDEYEFLKLTAHSWHHDEIKFKKLDGYTTVIMTIGTNCKDSQEIFAKIDRLRQEVPGLVQIFVFPFMIDGEKDRPPDQHECEEEFSLIFNEVERFERNNVHITKLCHINGHDPDPIIAYLKKATNMENLTEDDETYFFVNPFISTIHVLHEPHWRNVEVHVREHVRHWEL